MPVAYITGATSGIGRATAERFIEEGWTVVAMARREERLQELQDAHPGSVHCFKLDVRDKAAVEHVFSEAKERFGAPDVLVNNAGWPLAWSRLRRVRSTIGIRWWIRTSRVCCTARARRCPVWWSAIPGMW